MKVNFSEGNYLKAADVPQPVTVTIASVSMDTIQPDEPAKVVVTFRGLGKPLVLNKTNGNIIVELYGDDTDRWLNQPLEIYATTTHFQGRMVPCIRVRAATSQPSHQPAPAAPQHQPATVPQPSAQPPQYRSPPPVQAPPADIPFDA